MQLTAGFKINGKRNNRDGWDQYSAKDANLINTNPTDGSGVELAVKTGQAIVQSTTGTSDTPNNGGFKAGMNLSNTNPNFNNNVSAVGTFDATTLSTSSNNGGAHRIVFDTATNSVWTAKGNSVKKLNPQDINGAPLATYTLSANGNVTLAFDSITNSVWAYVGQYNVVGSLYKIGVNQASGAVNLIMIILV